MNMQTGKVTLDHPSHVPVRALNPYQLDLAIRRYLPASPNDLRRLLEQKIGGAADFSDVGTVAELLIFLASYDSASQ